ncbi:MAG: hypothetical protein HYZ88_01800 [Candidatus Omnitrophica bacterium]|nr:hypothetical protein [Candidatus Omnitrophota bacterium]
MKRRRIVIGFLAGIGVCAAGFVPWRVTEAVQSFLNGPRMAGWSFSVGQAFWAPWKSLKMRDVMVQTPGGGKLHLVKAEFFLKPRSLFKGSFSTEWVLGEIRMDPVSWNIRSALAQEILSASPVTTGGSGILELRREEIRIERFLLTGSVLQMSGNLAVGARRQIQLHLQGDLSREILEAMQLLSSREPSEPWQPFELRLEGRIDSPRIQFESNFRSFILDQRLERNP